MAVPRDASRAVQDAFKDLQQRTLVLERTLAALGATVVRSAIPAAASSSGDSTDLPDIISERFSDDDALKLIETRFGDGYLDESFINSVKERDDGDRIVATRTVDGLVDWSLVMGVPTVIPSDREFRIPAGMAFMVSPVGMVWDGDVILDADGGDLVTL